MKKLLICSLIVTVGVWVPVSQAQYYPAGLRGDRDQVERPAPQVSAQPVDARMQSPRGDVPQQRVEPAPYRPASPAQPVQAYDNRGRPNPDAFDWTGVAIGMNAGTTGVGLDGTFYLADWVNFRMSANYFMFTYKTTKSQYDHEFDMSTLGMLFLFDLYPGERKGFRFTAGVALRDNEIDIYGTPRSNNQLGIVRGTAEYDLIAPYIGIGWGNAVRPDSLLTFTMDIGLIYQGYSLKLNAEGQGDIGDVRSDVEDVLDLFKFYPVISFGLAYHF